MHDLRNYIKGIQMKKQLQRFKEAKIRNLLHCWSHAACCFPHLLEELNPQRCQLLSVWLWRQLALRMTYGEIKDWNDVTVAHSKMFNMQYVQVKSSILCRQGTTI